MGLQNVTVSFPNARPAEVMRPPPLDLKRHFFQFLFRFVEKLNGTRSAIPTKQSAPRRAVFLHGGQSTKIDKGKDLSNRNARSVGRNGGESIIQLAAKGSFHSDRGLNKRLKSNGNPIIAHKKEFVNYVVLRIRPLFRIQNNWKIHRNSVCEFALKTDSVFFDLCPFGRIGFLSLPKGGQFPFPLFPRALNCVQNGLAHRNKKTNGI